MVDDFGFEVFGSSVPTKGPDTMYKDTKEKDKSFGHRLFGRKDKEVSVVAPAGRESQVYC